MELLSENRDEFSTVRDIIDALYKIRPSICSYVRRGAMCIINEKKEKRRRRMINVKKNFSNAYNWPIFILDFLCA